MAPLISRFGRRADVESYEHVGRVERELLGQIVAIDEEQAVLQVSAKAKLPRKYKKE